MIRNATIHDRAQVLKIYDDARAFIASYHSPQWQEAGPSAVTFAADLAAGTLFVDEINNQIISVATISDYEPTYERIDGAWLSDKRYAVIHRIAVRINDLGKNYGSVYFDFVRNQGFESVRIDTHRLNQPMQRMLIKHGFSYCGIIYLTAKVDKERLAYQKDFTS